jgi:hypothetical protein
MSRFRSLLPAMVLSAVGATVACVATLFVAELAALSSRGAGQVLLPYAPMVLLIGIGVGAVSGIVRLHGCLAIVVGGLSWLAGMVVAFYILSSTHSPEPPASLIILTIVASPSGVVIGGLLAWGLVTTGRGLRWLAQRLVRAVRP